MRGDPWLVTLGASRTFNVHLHDVRRGFSTALTEAVPSSYLGSALALRSLLGFGAGRSRRWRSAPARRPNEGGMLATTWGWAFVTLGLGGLAAAYRAWGPGKER